MTTKPKGKRFVSTKPLKVWVMFDSSYAYPEYEIYLRKQDLNLCHLAIICCNSKGKKLFGPMKDGEIKRFEITAKEVKRG